MIIWIIGMSAAGKTVVSRELYNLIKPSHKHTVLLDGDVFRGLHNNDVDHTVQGRKKNSDRITRMCQFLDSQDLNVVCAVLSIFPDAQQWNRENYRQYYEIFLDVSLDTLIKRDPKGLYKMALGGEMPNMVGVDIDFPRPPNPDLIINNEGQLSPEMIAQQIYEQIKSRL